jgi:hypothetical protein
MALDGFEIAKTAAGFVVSYYSGQQQAGQIAAQVAEQLQENNAEILKGVATLLRQAFSQVKLDHCNTVLKTITTFMNEYNVNPSDQAKLIAVDQQAEELLNTLDDTDIAIAGIANWMIAANIRLLALQAKAKTEPADLINAKNRARDYSAYVNLMIPKVHDSIVARFSPVGGPCPVPSVGTIALGPLSACPGLWCYSCDDNVDLLNLGATEAEANSKRETAVRKVTDPPINSMRDTIQAWQTFASHP